MASTVSTAPTSTSSSSSAAFGLGGGGGGSGSRPDVTLRLPQLQNLCKRDPPAYREDYDAQIRRLRSEASILALSPGSGPSPRLVELIQFAAAVCSSSYKGPESDSIATLLIDLLLGRTPSADGEPGAAEAGADLASDASGPGDSSASIVSIPPSALHLHREVRKSCVSALILMRNKGAVPPLRLLELFFRIMSSVPDKGLRETLHRHIVNDVRNINKKGKRDEKVNRSIQAFLHRVVTGCGTPSLIGTGIGTDRGDVLDESPSDLAAKRAVEMVAELYRRSVWNDDRTVAIMETAVKSPTAAVMTRAMRFFLGIEETMEADRKREEEDEWNGINTVDLHLHSRKTRNRSRHVARQVKNRQKAQIKKEHADHMALENPEDKGVEHGRKLYPAIELLRDPQGLAEAVFKRVRSAGSNTYRFEAKLLMINFVTRLVGNHSLLVLPLYPFLQRYLGGHQRDVTAVLAYAVQACHEMVPPDQVYGLLKTISHNFVTERCSEEQMAVGINAARAICSRVPSVLSLEDEGEGAGSGVAMDVEAFARDLAAYAGNKDRSVATAGRSWANFVREVHPFLLKGKDRGGVGSALHRAGQKPLRYGETKISSGVEGAELLVRYEAMRAKRKERKAAAGDDGDDSGSEGSWEEPMNDEDEEDEDEDCDVEKDGAGKDSGDEEKETERSEGDDKAPDLMLVTEIDGEMVPPGKDDQVAVDEKDDETKDPNKMSVEQRDKVRQEISSTRIFTSTEMIRMRRLVEREEKVRRDPRAAAKRKRAIAKGEDYEALSDDDDNSDDEGVHTAGAVTIDDIQAVARKKRQSKAERLEKVLAGRGKFEHNERDGGSTNNEKKRKKNFVMTKFSFENRQKASGKETARQAKQKKSKSIKDSRKRRRKS